MAQGVTKTKASRMSFGYQGDSQWGPDEQQENRGWLTWSSVAMMSTAKKRWAADGTRTSSCIDQRSRYKRSVNARVVEWLVQERSAVNACDESSGSGKALGRPVKIQCGARTLLK